MRAVLAVCLLAACATGPHPTSRLERVELRGDVWTIAYRLILDDPAAPRLEGTVAIRNTTAEDWRDAKVTLATATAGSDRDGDGLVDRLDLCPGDREDVDGYNDDDGCPEADNDSDRILDDTDRCPNEREIYNGMDDEDGCPDRGTVVITNSGNGVVDWVFFPSGSDVIKPVSYPILDAVAATIIGNPRLRLIEVTGHTDRTERDPWSLSLRRAIAVRSYLTGRNVATERLLFAPYAATQPLASGSSPTDLAKNRRVGFTIVAYEDDGGTPEKPAYRPRFAPDPREGIDDLRYDLAQPVTLGAGKTATLTILDKPISAHDVRIWQPDEDVPRSAAHPFQAFRVVNTSGFVLQRGPIEVVQGGRVVFRGVLRRLGIGETTWIRGELDGRITVTATATMDERPARIVGGDRGELVVENLRSQKITYLIAPADAQPLEIHHRRLPDHEAPVLPSGTVTLADRFIIARAHHPSFEIVEKQAHRVTRSIATIPPSELVAYLDGAKLPPEIGDPLRAVLTPLLAIESGVRAGQQLRVTLGERALRWQQRPQDRAARAELDEIARAIGQTTELLERERARLDDLIAKLPTW